MIEQYPLPKPTIWRLKDDEATEHYGRPIHIYYDGADLRLGHQDTEKMTALLEPLFTSEQVLEAIAKAVGGGKRFVVTVKEEGGAA